MKCSCWICALIGLLWLSIVVRAAEPPSGNPPAARGLDAELLDGLDDELFDGLELPPATESPRGGRPPQADTPAQDREPAAGQRRPSSPRDAQTRELDDEVLRGLNDVPLPGDLDEGAEDPLVRMGNRMRNVQQRIGRGQSGEETQRLQNDIVSDLDKLIEQIRQSPQSRGGSSGQQSQQQQQQASSRQQVEQPQATPGQASTNSSGQPGGAPSDSTQRVEQGQADAVDMNQMNDLMKDLWGHLPERQRQQMLQSAVEQFLPKYETMIQSYFRRLAEEANQP